MTEENWNFFWEAAIIVGALSAVGLVGVLIYLAVTQREAISDFLRGRNKDGVPPNTVQPLKDKPSDVVSETKPVDENGAMESNASQPQNNEEKKKQAIEELCKEVPNRPIFIAQEETNRKEYKKKGLDVTGEGVVKALMRQLVGFQVAHAAERAYGAIFGSQIALLKRINEWGAVSSSYLSTYHKEEVKPKVYGQQDSVEEQYLAYLFNHNLIVQKEDTVYITDFGKEFLLWITYSQRMEDKPF